LQNYFQKFSTKITNTLYVNVLIFKFTEKVDKKESFDGFYRYELLVDIPSF